MSQYKNKILAKPSGISLAEHTKHVKEEGTYIISSLPFLAQKYKLICGGNLEKDLTEAAKYHDWGKDYHIWQNACRKDNSLYRSWRKAKKLSEDVISSDDYRLYEKEMRKKGKMPAKHIFKANLRHELASLYFINKNDINLSNKIKAAIASHHGKLSFKHRSR